MIDSAQRPAPTDTDAKTAGYFNWLRKQYIEESLAAGLVITYPANNELQIDIDSDADMARHELSWAILSREFALNEEDRLITPSKGGGTGRHIRIMLPMTLTAEERIAFQAALGSDPVRELLSMMRHLRGDEHQTLLAETKETAAAIDNLIEEVPE